jgi:hypothetical protein
MFGINQINVLRDEGLRDSDSQSLSTFRGENYGEALYFSY